jgi:uncharacterized surface protein with fasciclin (FAS1) repeats
MHNQKNTHWAIAGAVAAMLAVSTAGVHAQDATMTPPAPAMSGSMASSTSMDYSLLSNPHYDYIDLQQAKARGLSDSQIATIAKIATKSGMSFSEVSAAVKRGETFPALAAQYNLKLGDVYENEKEKQEIADYTSLYESAGTKTGMSGGSMSSDSSMGNMASAGTSGSDMSTPMASAAPAMAPLDIVDTAMAAKNLTTLVTALQVAGLVETLKGAGPFTVFAPTDKAFSKLPAGQLDALLADPAKLKTVLTYHVIPASIMAADASAMSTPTTPPTVEGATLQVTKGSKGLKVNGANIVKADIKASNGVIHVIDEVLMPPMNAPGQ